MSEETKLNNDNSTELPENFFEQDQIEAEKRFQEQYQQFPSGTTEILEDETSEETDDNESTEETDDALDFNFDDSLAQDELKELEELNAKLGTDFKSMDELKKGLNQVDKKEELNEIEVDKKYVGYYNNVLSLDDKGVVLESLRLKALDAGDNLQDPTVIERINSEVEEMEENRVLSFAADSVRNNWKAQLQLRQSKIDAFETGQKQTQAEKEAERKTKLQASVNDIFKSGKFMGVVLKKADLIDAYKDVMKNKHIEHLKTNPEDAIKFALFKKYQPEIDKILSKPSFNDGVKKTLSKLGLEASEQTTESSKQNDNDQEKLSFLERFIQ